jgi:hypothetical protein
MFTEKEFQVLKATIIEEIGNSPARAKIEIDRLKSDPKWRLDAFNGDSPGHSLAVGKQTALFQIAYPENTLRGDGCFVGASDGVDIVFPDGPITIPEPGDHLEPTLRGKGTKGKS